MDRSKKKHINHFSSGINLPGWMFGRIYAQNGKTEAGIDFMQMI